MAKTKLPGMSALLKLMAPVTRAAFLAAVNDMRDTVMVGKLIDAIMRGEIEQAITLMHINNAAFGPVADAAKNAYDTAGNLTTQKMPKIPDGPNAGEKLLIRFDGRSPRAEEWLLNYSSDKIVEMVNDQTLAIRNALRNGLERGDNPRTVAYDLIGRWDDRKKERTGSIIGLTSKQEEFVNNARSLLAGGSEDLARFRSYKLRDKRFDATLDKAIRGEIVLTPEQIGRMTAEYKDNMLQLRAETIGRTETMSALHAGKNEAMAQALDTGEVDQQDVTRTWNTAGDTRVRDSHAEMHGETVAWGERYSNGLEFPGDPSGPASEVINCRCDENIEIDFIGRAQRQMQEGGAALNAEYLSQSEARTRGLRA